MPRSDFREVKVLRDPDGLIAVISERTSTGHIRFMLACEFDRAGEVRRSSFLARRHIGGARRLLDSLEEELDAIEDRARAEKRVAR